MDEDMRRVVVKEHYRQGDVVRALREAEGLELDDDTLCSLAAHCTISAASFAHEVMRSPSRHHVCAPNIRMWLHPDLQL